MRVKKINWFKLQHIICARKNMKFENKYKGKKEDMRLRMSVGNHNK